jgi:hypothetical protein
MLDTSNEVELILVAVMLETFSEEELTLAAVKLETPARDETVSVLTVRLDGTAPPYATPLMLEIPVIAPPPAANPRLLIFANAPTVLSETLPVVGPIFTRFPTPATLLTPPPPPPVPITERGVCKFKNTS